MHFLTSLLTPFVALGMALSGYFAPEPQLGASEPVPTTIAFFETTLASAISGSATSFTLTSATDKDGTTLASSTYAFVIDEGSSNEEIVIADCTGTACTNASRGVSVRTGNTEVTALKKSHRRGASVKMTDAPILPLVARILRGEGTVDFTPTTGGNLVTKTYVDALALGTTTVAATESDDGIAELATQTEMASSTYLGGSGSPLVLQSRYATSTAPTSGHVIPVTGSDGNLDSGFVGNFSSTTDLTIGSTPILSIGKYVWASTSVGTSTWSVPSGIKKIKVTVVGAGGSGGLSNTGTPGSGGSGGGAGGVAIEWLNVSATSVIQYHIANANTIDTTYFGTYGSPYLSATAGTTGAENGSPTAGGTGTGGDLNFSGGRGGGGGTISEMGGDGGNSIFGGGGGAGAGSGADNGGAAGACGAGGGGGADGGSGGAGAVGCIIIEY